MPFQAQVNIFPAPAVAGDFCSANPRASVLAGPGQLVAGSAGLIIARFGWIETGTWTRVRNYGPGAPDGFVGRQGNEALITTFLAETSMTIQAGREVTLYNEGEFWVVNSGSNQVAPGLKAYANNSTGLVTFAATGTAPQGASVTGAVTAGTGSVTGSIADNVLTVTAVGSGSLVVGATISGTNVVSGTKITEQLTGTAGGVGTYLVSIAGQSVASTTISATFGVLTVSAVGSGSLAVGQAVVSGGSLVAGTHISQLGTGTGGTGTYYLDDNTTQTSTTIVFAAGTETKWYSGSVAAPGELVKMTSWPRG